MQKIRSTKILLSEWETITAEKISIFQAEIERDKIVKIQENFPVVKSLHSFIDSMHITKHLKTT